MPDYEIPVGGVLSYVVKENWCNCTLTTNSIETLIGDGFLFILSICTVVVNMAFILTVGFNRPLHTYTNKLLVSNAFIDLLVGLIVMPFHILKHMQNHCWQFGILFCKLAQSWDIHLTTISIYHITGVAAERYFRIVRVFWYERWVKRLVPISIFLFWILPLPSTFGTVLLDIHQIYEDTFDRRLVLWNVSLRNTSLQTTQMVSQCGKTNPYEKPCRCSYWASQEFTTGTTFFQFLLPIIVMVYFYVRIFIVAYRQARKMEDIRISVAASSPSPTSLVTQQSRDSLVLDGDSLTTVSTTRRESRSRAALLFSKDIRMVRLCALVFLSFFLCWAPYFLMAMLEAYCVGANYQSDRQILSPTPEEEEERKALGLGFYSTLWLGLVNSLLNPILIFSMEKNYRNGLRIMLHQRVPWLARRLGVWNPRSRPYSLRLGSMRRTISRQSLIRENSEENTPTTPTPTADRPGRFF